MSRCSICLSPELPAIETALASGAFKKDVAAKFNVSAFALSRHVRHSAPAPETSTGTEEIGKWLARADLIWEQATADQDVRGQAQAVAAGLRALEAQSAHVARAAESEQPADGTIPEITMQQIDALMQNAEKWETPERKFVRQTAGALESLLACSGNAEVLGHVEQILRISNSDKLGEFLVYKQRRIAEGDRCDMPAKRGSDELFISEITN